MNDDNGLFIPARRSLLIRHKDQEGREGWQVFFEIHWKLIYHVGPQLTKDRSMLPISVMKSFALALALFMPTFLIEAGSLYTIPIKDIDGKSTTLKQYQGKVLLVVNVASQCGLTPQYESLEATYEKYKNQGLVVLGFPCNQFGGQEPGTNEEIKKFCSDKYSVSFPLFDKLEVNGPNRHALYVALAGKESPYPGDIQWNFGKFLIGRDGKIAKRFDPKTKPDSPEVVSAIEAALAAK